MITELDKKRLYKEAGEILGQMNATIDGVVSRCEEKASKKVA